MSVALPRAPINLVAARVDSTSAQLHWDPGSDDPIESYTVRWQRRQLPREPQSEMPDIVNTEHTVNELVPYSTYEVEVVAVNNIGPSLPASVVITTNEDGEAFLRILNKQNITFMCSGKTTAETYL